MKIIINLIATITLLSSVCFAQSYKVDRYVIASGGGFSQSTNYTINSTFGQGIIGKSISTNYIIEAGFWVGIGGPSGYQYLPADMGMYYYAWPPQVQGGDVTYYVNFMRQYASSIPCYFDGPLGMFWASADVNGSCAVDGADLSTLVSVMRNILSPMYCDQYPTVWPTPLDLPPTEPSGWPNCANSPPVTGARVIPTNPVR